MGFKEGDKVKHIKSGKQGLVLSDSEDSETQVLFDGNVMSVFVPTKNLEIVPKSE